jgi:hypothetical protein
MASEYFGLNRGDSGNIYKVQTGTSTSSTDVELRADLTKSLTRLDIELLVETIMNFINSGNQNTTLPL